MKLTSTTDYILDQNKNSLNTRECFMNCLNYANFLKQPLELWMFVPCDEEGNVLQEPSHYQLFTFGIAPNDTQMNECGKYQQAKERCLFEFNLEFINFDKSDMENQNIENLLSDDLYYILTPTAIK